MQSAADALIHDGLQSSLCVKLDHVHWTLSISKHITVAYLSQSMMPLLGLAAVALEPVPLADGGWYTAAYSA